VPADAKETPVPDSPFAKIDRKLANLKTLRHSKEELQRKLEEEQAELQREEEELLNMRMDIEARVELIRVLRDLAINKQ
jgi:hypothetical protein